MEYPREDSPKPLIVEIGVSGWDVVAGASSSAASIVSVVKPVFTLLRPIQEKALWVVVRLSGTPTRPRFNDERA